MLAILNFMYNGEVNVNQVPLERTFLRGQCSEISIFCSKCSFEQGFVGSVNLKSVSVLEAAIRLNRLIFAYSKKGIAENFLKSPVILILLLLKYGIEKIYYSRYMGSVEIKT
jgi:hypothetical protein